VSIRKFRLSTFTSGLFHRSVAATLDFQVVAMANAKILSDRAKGRQLGCRWIRYAVASMQRMYMDSMWKLLDEYCQKPALIRTWY
jgi:hypothetical protein